MKKHIFLAGFMGAGKSKIGRILSKEFAWTFYDTDNEIEKQAGKTIKEIFEQDGELAFRQMEKDVVAGLAVDVIPSVISLGGGALMDRDNFTIITKTGILVYIRSAPQALYERVKNSSKRPLLKQGAQEDMLEQIRGLLNERSAVYEQADIIFDRDGLTLDEIIKSLYKRINQYWQG